MLAGQQPFFNIQKCLLTGQQAFLLLRRYLLAGRRGLHCFPNSLLTGQQALRDVYETPLAGQQAFSRIENQLLTSQCAILHLMQKDNALETYVQLIGTDYQPALERFSRVLLSLGMPAAEVQQAADAFEWEVTDIFGHGWVHGWDIGAFKISGSAVTLYPFFTGYTPRVDDATADNWIHCGFWIDSPDLIPQYIRQGHVPFHYPPEAQQLITTLARAMHHEFGQAAIYFTEDGQETALMAAVMDNDASKRWQFHYAVFSLEPLSAYMPIPASHAGRFGGGCFEAWDRKTWPQFES